MICILHIKSFCIRAKTTAFLDFVSLITVFVTEHFFSSRNVSSTFLFDVDVIVILSSFAILLLRHVICYLRLQILVPLILVFKNITVINKIRTPANIHQILISTKVVLLNTRKTTSLKFSIRNYYYNEKYLH